MSALGSDQEATFFTPSDPELRIDFLTPRHRGADALLKIANLNVKLQPLKFMEYLLEHPTQAVLFCEEGAVVVSVPTPLRYALHKLLVWHERGARWRTKANKDLLQAAALIAYHKENRPDELRQAWRDLINRGKGWKIPASKAVEALDAVAPELLLADYLASGPPGSAKRPVKKKTKTRK